MSSVGQSSLDCSLGTVRSSEFCLATKIITEYSPERDPPDRNDEISLIKAFQIRKKISHFIFAKWKTLQD